MREWLFAQGVIVYVFGVCTIVGLVSAFVANRGYKRLIKDTESMAGTNNRLLKYIKLKFGSYYKLGMKPQDTKALAWHYLYKYKIGFFNVNTWIKASKAAAGLIILSGLLKVMLLAAQAKTWADIAAVVLSGAFAWTLLSVQHQLCDFKDKQERATWFLMDYLENFLKNKIESGKNLSMMVNEEPVKESKTKMREAAATSISPAFVAPEDTNPYPKAEKVMRKKTSADMEDVDSKVVEDILNEFLM